MRLRDFLYALFALLIVCGALYLYYFISVEEIPLANAQRGYALWIEEGLLVISTVSLLFLLFTRYVMNRREHELGAMKSDFIAIASHEIRSPLASIRWGLSELRADGSLSMEQRANVEDLYKRVLKVIDLTTTFLQTTSIDHGVMNTKDLKIVDIVPIIRDSVAHAQSIAVARRISVRIDSVIEKPIFVRGDAARLQLVFVNLLSNAIKYSPEGALVSLSHSVDGSHASFSVHDQGIGIPASDIKHIFSGFHRASNAKRPGTPGTGFGLYMVKKIVDFHGGKITCESKINEGTTFTVTLPTGV